MYFYNPTLNERLNANVAYNAHGVLADNANERGWFNLDLTPPAYNRLIETVRDNGTVLAADGVNYVVDWEIVKLPLEAQVTNISREFDKQLEAHFDKVAKAKGYTDRVTCSLRAGLANSPFQAEGIAFGTWMDNCYATLYAALEDVKAGTTPVPASFSEVLAILPAAPWALPVETNTLDPRVI